MYGKTSSNFKTFLKPGLTRCQYYYKNLLSGKKIYYWRKVSTTALIFIHNSRNVLDTFNKKGRYSELVQGIGIAISRYVYSKTNMCILQIAFGSLVVNKNSLYIFLIYSTCMAQSYRRT